MEYLGGGSALDLMKAGKISEIYVATILREILKGLDYLHSCLLYTSPSPRDATLSRMPSSA